MFFLELPWYERGIRGLMAFICQVLYSLIASAYNLFINIANVNILNEKQVAPIYQRVTMLLTIIMVFYVTFQFVKFIVQPDEISDKEKGAGKIIYKMIMVVVLIAFVPKLFTAAFAVQSKIINNDLIGKIILGQANTDISNFGNNFAANIFGMFYRFEPDPERGIEEDAECDGVQCKHLVAMNLNMMREEGTLTYLTIGLNASEEVSTKVKNETEEMALINFNYLLAIGVGGLVLWMLIMYCIEAGTRWAQLIFLQIIAPIPIIGYLSPKKDGIFQKWAQQCFTTYIDLFMRFAIIYFILLICQVLTEAFEEGPNTFLGLTNLSIGMKIFVYIALVVGLLLFAKKAPKMLEELFPKKGAASGSFGLSGKERLKGIGRALGAIGGTAIGAAAGLATGIGQGIRKSKSANTLGGKIAAGLGGGLWGGVRGTVGGATRGVVNGAKKGNPLKNSITGAKNQIASNKRFGNKMAQGYTLGDQIEDKFRGAFGMKSRIDSIEGGKAPLKRQQNVFSEQAKINDQMRDYAFKKAQEKGYAGKYQNLAGELERLQKDPAERGKYGSEQEIQARMEIVSKEMKKAKDEATNLYIDTGDDAHIAGLIDRRQQLIEEHNKNEQSSTNHISDTATFKVNGVEVTKNISEMTAEEFDEYVKQVAKKREREIAKNLYTMEQEQEAIKRQTEGTENKGNK